MATISETQLSNWTNPPFNNEDQKAKDTEVIIREAVRGHDLLSTLPIDVYAKGSYKNNTTVRRDSDVDVAVEYTGILYFDYATSTNREEVWAAGNISEYRGPFATASGGTDIMSFKNAVGDAMRGAFSVSAVQRSNKVFTVRESSRSLAADVVPCASFRYYTSATSYRRGIKLIPDDDPAALKTNYPEQHYANGVLKNGQTSRRFKSVVRILKNLENRMVEDGVIREVPSFLIECLVYNAPNHCFNATTWAQRVRNVLVHAWEDTDADGWYERWLEVNECKYLFHDGQKWTLAEARAFVHAAWQYVENA